MLQLIADIGGTNARFALHRQGAITNELVLACADFPDIVAAIEHYLQLLGAVNEQDRPQAAAIAIAGPVAGDQIRMTNHSWQFSASAVRRALRPRTIFCAERLHGARHVDPAFATERIKASGRRNADTTQALGADRAGHRTGRIGTDSL